MPNRFIFGRERAVLVSWNDVKEDFWKKIETTRVSSKSYFYFEI
jgi:hypothetical protein